MKEFYYDKKTCEILRFSANIRIDPDMINIRRAWESPVRRRIILEIKRFKERNKRNPIISEIREMTHTPKSNLSLYIRDLKLMGIIALHENITKKGHPKEIELLIEPVEVKENEGFLNQTKEFISAMEEAEEEGRKEERKSMNKRIEKKIISFKKVMNGITNKQILNHFDCFIRHLEELRGDVDE